MKKVSKTVVAFLIFLMVALVFSASLPEKTRAAYPPEGETALFADPDFIDVSGASRPATYSFDVKIQNKAGVVTIAFDLAFDPNIVEILSITPNPNNELPGGVLLIGDDPTTPNVIEMITYGILGAWWDITTPKSAVRITVKLKDFTPPTGTKLDITNMDCYDKEGYNFLTGDCPYDNTAYYCYETLLHSVTADSQTFYVETRSNSTITNFEFSQTEKSITFNVTGSTGTKGWVNVTIPKVLLDGPWVILIDNNDVTGTATITTNQTHTFIYITYTHSTHKITIIGTYVIPEYTPLIMLTTLITITATTILATSKRKLYILKRKR